MTATMITQNFSKWFFKKKIILENRKIIKNSKLNIFSSDYLKNKFSKRKKIL